jgi:hypothetical protein
MIVDLLKCQVFQIAIRRNRSDDECLVITEHRSQVRSHRCVCTGSTQHRDLHFRHHQSFKLVRQGADAVDSARRIGQIELTLVAALPHIIA